MGRECCSGNFLNKVVHGFLRNMKAAVVQRAVLLLCAGVAVSG